MKLHSIYLFRYHIVFYLGNVYNNMALSSTDGNAGDRSVLSLCMSCDITAVHSIERLPMKTDGTETPSHGESRPPYTNAQPLFFSISNIYLSHLYTCGHVLCRGTHVEVRGQLVGVGSFLLLCRFQGQNSGPQTASALTQ